MRIIKYFSLFIRRVNWISNLLGLHPSPAETQSNVWTLVVSLTWNSILNQTFCWLCAHSDCLKPFVNNRLEIAFQSMKMLRVQLRHEIIVAASTAATAIVVGDFHACFIYCLELSFQYFMELFAPECFCARLAKRLYIKSANNKKHFLELSNQLDSRNLEPYENNSRSKPREELANH